MKVMSDNNIIKCDAWNSFLLPLVTPNSVTFFYQVIYLIFFLWFRYFCEQGWSLHNGMPYWHFLKYQKCYIISRHNFAEQRERKEAGKSMIINIRCVDEPHFHILISFPGSIVLYWKEFGFGFETYLSCKNFLLQTNPMELGCVQSVS